MGWLHIPPEPYKEHRCQAPKIVLGLRKRYIGALWSCDQCGQLWEWNYEEGWLGLEPQTLMWIKRNVSA